MTPPALARLISPDAWLGYSADDTDDFIRADYLRRYGVLPEEIVRRGGSATVLVGPVDIETKSDVVYNENV